MVLQLNIDKKNHGRASKSKKIKKVQKLFKLLKTFFKGAIYRNKLYTFIFPLKSTQKSMKTYRKSGGFRT